MTAPSRTAKIMNAQFKAFIKDDDEYLMATIDESDPKIWYFMVSGLLEPYAGGEYVFRLKAPDDFPQRPPEFEFVTPNGVYDVGGKICISIGEFHAKDAPKKDGATGWRAALGMKGFAKQVVNGMIVPETLGGGIRILGADAEECRQFAKDSQNYNSAKKYGRVAISRLLEGFDDFAKANPGLKACSRWINNHPERFGDL